MVLILFIFDSTSVLYLTVLVFIFDSTVGSHLSERFLLRLEVLTLAIATSTLNCGPPRGVI